MKILESKAKFKIFNERFIGIPKTREIIGKVYPPNYKIISWEIFDAKNLKTYMYMFDDIQAVDGNIFAVKKNDKLFFAKFDEDMSLIGSIDNVDCEGIKDNIAIVRNKDNSKCYVKIQKDKIEKISDNFIDVKLPAENIACVKCTDNYWRYGVIKNDNIKIIDDKFLDVESFSNGYGIVVNLDKTKSYVAIKNNQLFQSADFVDCLPLTEGIARFKDDNGWNYGKIDDNLDVIYLSKSYNEISPVEDGFACVRNKEDNSVTYFRFNDKGEMEFLGQGGVYCNPKKTISSFKDGKNFSGKINIVTIEEKEKDKPTKTYDAFGVYNKYDDGLNKGSNFVLANKTFYKIHSVKDNIGIVEYAPNKFGYVLIKDKKIDWQSPVLVTAREFVDGNAVCANINRMDQYVRFEDNQLKPISKNYVQCDDYSNGFGIGYTIKRHYEILDKDGLPLVRREHLAMAIKENPAYEKYRLQLEKYKKECKKGEFSL